MGQAKRRGSREERIVQALNLKKITLPEIKQELDLPDGAVFVGYAVHLEKSDEFLAEFEDSEEQGIVKKMWAKTPMLAQRYESIVDAYSISEQCKNSVVVGMFDIGDQIVTYTLQNAK